MNAYAQRTQDQRSRAVANSFSQRGQVSTALSSRPHRLSALQERANHRPQVRQVVQLRQILNPGRDSQAPAQWKENRTGMPARLKAGIEGLSNLSLDDVTVEYNSPKPARFRAHAITQGKEIHVGPGQEHHLPHEAWHVVQQKQGRVRATTQMHGAAINTDSALEREADIMGARASTLTGRAAGLEGAPLNCKSSSKSVSSQPVGQLFPWELLPALGGSYGAFVMHNYLQQQDLRNDPQRYSKRPPLNRLGAVLETLKGKPGQAGHVMHWPVSLFHLLAGNIGSSNIGEHYRKDIPHLLQGPATDANFKTIGKIETHDFWRQQKEFAPYHMGRMLNEKTRAQSLMRVRDMHFENAQNPSMFYRSLQSLMKPRAVSPVARLLPVAAAGVGALVSASLAYNKYGKKEEE